MIKKTILADAETRMGKVEKILISDFASLRAGQATLLCLTVSWWIIWHSPLQVNQTANISCPEPRMILIQPGQE